MPIAHFVPGGAVSHFADDLAGRALHVGHVDDFHRAFGMDQNLDARDAWRGTDRRARPEHLVHAAVPLPQQHLAASQIASAVLPPSSSACGSQTGICVERNAHRLGRVAAQVLIGKEQHAAACARRPTRSTAAALLDVQTMPPCLPQNAFRLAAELMYVTGVMSAGVDHFAQFFPGSFDLVDRGHVGHRAAGRHVGQHDGHALAAARGQLLGPVGQDVGRLGHEVDAAEGDRPAVAAFGRHLAELVAVAAQVGERDHFVLLIVVPQNQQPRTEFRPHGVDPLGRAFRCRASGTAETRRRRRRVGQAIAASWYSYSNDIP